MSGETLIIEYSTFQDTFAGSLISWMFTGIASAIGGAGGAVSSAVDMTVVGSTFRNSRADQAGGALCSARSLTVTTSSFFNCTSGSYGGVMASMLVALSPAPLSMSDSVVRLASAALDGGAPTTTQTPTPAPQLLLSSVKSALSSLTDLSASSAIPSLAR